jgi:hypothetical protein
MHHHPLVDLVTALLDHQSILLLLLMMMMKVSNGRRRRQTFVVFVSMKIQEGSSFFPPFEFLFQ